MKKISLSLLLLLLLSCNNEDSNSNEIDRLNNKWMLERSFLNNTEQNLSTCKKRSYIQFNTNNTFTRKDYFLEGNVCQLEGSDSGNYTYNASTNRITLSYTDVDDGAIVEVLTNVNFTNIELFFSFDEDMNGVYEYNLEFIKE
jgi:hypothetical protein